MAYTPYELYSYRNRNRALNPDIFEYDTFPKKFRTQFFLLFTTLVDEDPLSEEYSEIADNLSLEFGSLDLNSCSSFPPKYIIQQFLLMCSNSDFLDTIDYLCHELYTEAQHPGAFPSGLPVSTYLSRELPNFFDQLNYRFRQNNLGYEVYNGQIIRKDSELLHQEVVKPTLCLLAGPEFKPAEKELLNAFELRRNDNFKDCITSANRAFESVMKTICTKRGYSFDPVRDNAHKLVQTLTRNDFFPAYMESHLTHLSGLLSDGLPTLRNKDAAHGAAPSQPEPTAYHAEYAVHLACANIKFLIQLYNS